MSYLFAALQTRWIAIVLTSGVALFATYLLVDSRSFISSTEGTVFVETPQIYTRERLVNDRFVQESWLREVLKEEPDFSPMEILAVTDRKKIGVAVGTVDKQNPSLDVQASKGPEGSAAQSSGDGPVAARPRVPPAVLFQLRNAYRELIRTQLIENQLDDRHDIRGTTIYLLKFDVAIVPGNNTRKRAFIRVRATRDAPSKSIAPSVGGSESSSTASVKEAGAAASDVDCPTRFQGPSERPTSSQAYFIFYVENACQFSDFSGGEDRSALLEFDLYNQWRASLRDRLNTALADLLHRFRSNKFRYSEYYDFLSDLAESGDSDWFSNWANSLSKLQARRDEIRKDLGKGSGGDSPALTASVNALDHRFDLVAKSILTAAVNKKPIDLEGLQAILDDKSSLPDPIENSRMRDALIEHAIRRVGMAVVGDPSFRLEKYETTSEKSWDIRSNTLDRFVSMRLQSTASDRIFPTIELDPRYAGLFSFQQQEIDNLRDKKGQCAAYSMDKFEYQPISSYREAAPSGTTQQNSVYRSGTSIAADAASAGQNPFTTDFIPSFMLKSDNLRLAFSKVNAVDLGYGECLKSAKAITLPIGLLNFVNSVVDIQTYTYATLPRIDLLVSDSSADSTQSGGLSIDVPGSEAAGAISNYYRRVVRSVEPKTSIVGFSGSICSSPGAATCLMDRLPPDEVNFGWVVSPSDDSKRPGDVLGYKPMQPTQRSVAALITVPFWWKYAHLEITSGWLTNDGTFQDRRTQAYLIPLPIDFESFDTLLTEPGRRDSRRPSIALERMPEDIQVEACARAEILIPGHRLWRSSVVVLGGQRADVVTVLPDMRGIIATFGEVARQGIWEKDDQAVRKLQVWTSEGFAQEVSVKINPATRTCKDGRAASDQNLQIDMPQTAK